MSVLYPQFDMPSPSAPLNDPSELLKCQENNRWVLIPKIKSCLEKVQSAMGAVIFQYQEGETSPSARRLILDAKRELDVITFKDVALGANLPAFYSQDDTCLKIYLNHLAEKTKDVLGYQEPSPRPLKVVVCFVMACFTAAISSLLILFGNAPTALFLGLATALLIKGILNNNNHDLLLQNASDIRESCKRLLSAY